MRGFAMAVLAWLIPFAAPPAAGAAELEMTFTSHDPVFLDALRPVGDARDRRLMSATLILPNGETGDAPLPAAVILHSSGGPGELERTMARELNRMGIAALVVDSFAPRGLRDSKDRARVTEAMMLSDAYGALLWLAKNPRIRADRIAAIGFSKGGTIALYAAMTEIADIVGGPGGPRFAAHIAYYPWCGLSLSDQHTTGAPILLHIGEQDNLAPAALCRTLAADIGHGDSAARFDLRLYPLASHAFNHPSLMYLPAIGVSTRNAGICRIVETAPHQYRETSTDRPLTSTNYRETVDTCAGRGGTVDYSSDATAKAAAATRELLTAILQPDPPHP